LEITIGTTLLSEFHFLTGIRPLHNILGYISFIIIVSKTVL
jgi:hypothetical protein